jgi:hypothetical protein
MLAAVALALLLDVPGPAPQATPLREVVYKVSSLRTESLAIETYGGRVPMGQSSSTAGQGPAGDPAPSSKNNATLQDGTLTVDVLGIQQDVIKVRVTEVFKEHPTPNSYNAYIAPSGLVRFETPDPSPIAMYLLPLFGSKFAASSTLTTGDSWHVDLKTDAVNLQNTFTIAGQDGPLLLLNEAETVRLNSARGMNYNVTGKLKYKPALLVPIAGDIAERGNRNTMDTTDESTTTVHFERVSDTLDQAQATK